MTVAYEHIRLVPGGPLTRELMERSLEDELTLGPTVDDIPSEDNEQASSQNATANHATPRTNALPYQATVPAPGDGLQPVSHDTCSQTIAEEPRLRPTFLSKAVIGHPAKYIGSTPVSQDPVSLETTLKSNAQMVLKHVHDITGNEQVTAKKLEFAPPWIVENAFNTEYESNWADAYEPVQECEVPPHANIITSHVVYKIKKDERDERTLKGRLVPHGNRDNEKHDIRKDSSTAQFDVIRLLLCLTTFLGLRLGLADIKGAYLQSGPIQRDIFVRPPREWKGQRGVLWKLTKLPYGIVEAGRQWAKAIEHWMLTDAKLERVHGSSQLYLTRDQLGNIILLVAKVTDDLLIAGSVPAIRTFISQLANRFKISKSIIDDRMTFNGCSIEQSATGDIRMSMGEYAASVPFIPITRARRKQQLDSATLAEGTAFKSLAGALLWVASGTLPQATYAASYLQQKLGSLKVQHLVEANIVLKELRQLDPTLVFRRPPNAGYTATVFTFSDASFNITSSHEYGQTGIITGITIDLEDGQPIYNDRLDKQ